MSSLSTTVCDGLCACYQNYARRVHTLAQPLSEEQFWQNPYPYGNSVGNLVLHLTGNLSYYIGAQIAESGYVRTRDREFTDSLLGHKQDVLKAFDDTVNLVIATLKTQTEADWERAYSAVGADSYTNRFEAFLHCAAHFHHHIGQMIYLTMEFSRKS